MTLMLTDVVWSERRYEAGCYDCEVVRSGDHGRLTVHLVTDYDRILLHAELVECDRPKTEPWRARSLDVITHPDLRRIEP